MAAIVAGLILLASGVLLLCVVGHPRFNTFLKAAYSLALVPVTLIIVTLALKSTWKEVKENADKLWNSYNAHMDDLNSL